MISFRTACVLTDRQELDDVFKGLGYVYMNPRPPQSGNPVLFTTLGTFPSKSKVEHSVLLRPSIS
jgi:hypothetical protein